LSKIEVNAVEPQCGTTLTLGASGDTVTLGSGASQSGFGRTGTVDWDTTPKTATFTAANGEGYFINTSGGVVTANLPAGSAGAIVSFADYTSSFSSNKFTISPNGSDKIGGQNNDVDLTTDGQSVTLVFVDSTEGWITVNDSSENIFRSPFIIATGGTITTCGNDRIHTFTGPGTFTVCNTAICAANNVVSYVVVAGGGAGAFTTGCNGSGGGGGAGGYREVKSPVTPYTASPLDGYPSAPNRVTVTATSFPITVGAGGALTCGPPSGPSTVNDGSNGSNSTFSTITSTGGGAGGLNSTVVGANAGGSGGGGPNGQGITCGGAGNTPPVSPAQGNPGGNGANPGSAEQGTGGGGGAGASGGNGSTSANGDGGAGVTSSINGTPTARAGGGGGGGNNPASAPGGDATGGAGGSGGGGAGGSFPNNTPAAVAGTANTGGGGGAGGSGPSGSNPGAAGGSGIVIIRYKFQ